MRSLMSRDEQDADRAQLYSVQLGLVRFKLSFTYCAGERYCRQLGRNYDHSATYARACVYTYKGIRMNTKNSQPADLQIEDTRTRVRLEVAPVRSVLHYSIMVLGEDADIRMIGGNGWNRCNTKICKAVERRREPFLFSISLSCPILPCSDY